MRKILLVIVLTLLPLPALAQTTPPIVAKSAINTFSQPCTTLQCTGLTGGFFISNGMMGADVGAQFWNGIAFVGVEIGGGGQVYTNPAYTLNENGFFSYQIGKAGGSVNGLFGVIPNPPATYPSLTANIIAPYGLAGAVERDLPVLGWQEGWAIGGGIEYDISAHLFADAKYMYVNYGSAKLPAESLILAGVSYKF